MEHVLTELADGVLRVRFNRAEKKNAITIGMYGALAEAFRSASADADVRAVLLHGTAELFTSGNDLGDFLANPPRGEDFAPLAFLRALSHCGKPVVAAVGGAAVGIGTTLLLHCDRVFVASNARFSLPFVNLGLVPEAASSILLPRLAGWQRAAQLLLLGEPFNAETAREIGLASEIVPPERLLATAEAAARQLAEKPPAALQATKALMKQALLPEIDAALAREGRCFAERLGSSEAKEALTAFFEKRKPDFSRT